MGEKREKVIYNITLQSEDDDEVKVIDRCATKLKAISVVS